MPFFACIVDDAQTLNGAMRNITRKKRTGRSERKVFQDFPSSLMIVARVKARRRCDAFRERNHFMAVAT
jgi:hypothetical protein